MEHKILFLPAFDRTDPDPKKNYGVGDLGIKFLVIGNKGIVEFDLSTNWYFDYVMDRRVEWIKDLVQQKKENFLIKHVLCPKPMDLCYYSSVKVFEDDCYFENGLHFLENKSLVYYGYKYMDEKENMVAHDVAYWRLIKQGEDALWQYLEEYYYEVFGQ